MYAKKLAVSLALAPLTMLAGFAASPAAATTYGVRWDVTRTITVYNGTTSSGYRIKNVISDWNATSRLRLVLTSNKAAANIVLSEADLPSPSVGSTALAWSGSTIVKANVTLDRPFALKYPSSAHRVALHEIGHALGLDHAPGSTYSVMGSGGPNWPSNYDYRDMRSLYGARV